VMSKRNHRDSGLGTRSSGVSRADSASESGRSDSPAQGASPRLQNGRGEDLRLRYLHAMGIDVWVPRKLGTRDSGPGTREIGSAGRTRSSDDGVMQAEPTPGYAGRSTSREDKGRQASFLSYAVSDSPALSTEHEVPLISSSGSPSSAGSDIARLDWPALQSRVASCTRCGLHRTRTQTVFGVGSQTADWLFIGEAPGRDEDAQGEPFVGRAGQLLNNMLRAIGFSREQVYIANILKCQPPRNRDPKPEEARTCEPYLQRQIAMLRPKVIVALGRIAAQNLLHTDMPIGRMRGRQYTYADTGIPVRVTYHPAYLLRSPVEKRKAWQDLLLAQKMVKAVQA
jgi:uracil-DNA glycosylase family 4